ncbi:hypothetical protein PV327_000919 [Microctonus hyperodae]|uniref:Cysteine proteinase n=1 Tax=Microctonus hyperodae TaxID=165561 RepID=A0AA39G917_MICHY|nr:hypothetical protein PV327_000919 [Microctonus hyperodae]
MTKIKMAHTKIFNVSKLLTFFFCIGFIGQTIATIPINISIQSVSDLLIQSALNTLNHDSPTRHTYKSGNLISAQKLLQPPYVIYRLTLSLEPDCKEESSCPREACVIDLKQNEQGIIEVDEKTAQCMYLYPQWNQDDRQASSSEGMQDLQEQEIIDNLDKQIINDTVKLDHEVQDVTDQNDRPFIAVRASHYCPGCPYELNPTLPGLETFREIAALSMDKSELSNYKHKVISIVSVTRAVPPGSDVVRYQLLMEIARTDCLITTSIPREECTVWNEPIQLCLLTFDERPWLSNNRQLTRNNCTESHDKIDNANSNIEPNLVSESLTNRDVDIDEDDATKSEIYDQIAQEGQISTYESPIDASVDVPVPTVESSNRDELIRAEITEMPFTQITLNKDDIKKEPVVGFTDKLREFDEFLKDFDISIKENNEEKSSNYGHEVIEEIIRPEHVESKVNFEKHEPNVKLSRKRRSLINRASESKFTWELAQKAMSLIDEIDSDDNKRVVARVIKSKKVESNEGIIHYLTILAAITNCKENKKNIKNCIPENDESLKICKLQVLTNDENSLESAQVKLSLCQDDEKIRNKRSGRAQSIPGGQQSIPIDDEIRDHVKAGLKHYSATAEGDNEPLLIDIISATRQIVSGTMLRINVKIGESNCPKGQSSETCLLIENSPIKDCLITVWSQPWLNKSPKITVKCEKSNSRKKRSLRGVNYSHKMLHMAQEWKDQADFEAFQKEHNRVYDSLEEKDKRFRIFQTNMRIAEKFQEYEQGTAKYGPTKFADMTTEEFRRYTGYRSNLRSENAIPYPMAKIPDIKLDPEFDWRNYNVVTPVKDQGSCGSCWAFSVTGNVEGLYAIKHKKLLSLSEQELVDCDKLDEGCNGGLQENAYRALEDLGGLELEDDYPYDGEDEKCHFKKSKAMVQVVSAVNITSNETQMAQWLVKNGPMAIGINANAMQFYMGGVSHPLSFLCNKNNLDHGVLIVGYGIHTYPIFKKKYPYWIVKNSWGSGWGEQGYYRVYRGDGTCGLNTDVTSAVVA